MVANLYIQYLRRCFPAVREQVSFHFTYPVKHPIKDKIPYAIKAAFSNDLMNAIEPPQSTIPSCEITPKQFIKTLLQNTTHEESYRSWRTSLEHPQNLLRNFAKSGCQTEYTLLPDIDMIPNKNLNLQLESFLMARQPTNCTTELKPDSQTKQGNCAFVIPVYEIENEVDHLPEDKNQLLKLVKNKLARPFHSALFSINQKASKLKQWESMQPNASQYLNFSDNVLPTQVNVAYKVDKYQFKYEPLYVAKSHTPVFDERFIGFGMTRNTQVKHRAGGIAICST